MTQLQARLLRYLQWHWWRYGKSPTRHELAAGFEVQVQTIDRRLGRLRKAGLVTNDRRLGWIPLR